MGIEIKQWREMGSSLKVLSVFFLKKYRLENLPRLRCLAAFFLQEIVRITLNVFHWYFHCRCFYEGLGKQKRNSPPNQF